MVINGYTSRNIPNPQVYADILEKRIKAKRSGDKVTANALKLVANTTYGAMLNQYNDLFDPLMGRSVCISGQLYLLELAQHLYKEIEDLRVIQCNTDGIMVEFDDFNYNKVKEITQEWQDRTGFELEEDSIIKIAQKDVNGYIVVQADGKVKAKGGYLVNGIAPAGAFNVNNSCVIVATALKEFFVNGAPVEDTINGCDDIFQFQIIAKASAKYKEAYHVIDGVIEPVQKVNRVYATADERYGKIYKVKSEDDSIAKIEMLPDHCIIDNDNHLTIDDVDKTFYIEMAKKRINDFLGIKPPKKNTRKINSLKKQILKILEVLKMTTKKTETVIDPTTMNVWQKLLAARIEFLRRGVTKSGINLHAEFKYFELEDIVPVATEIFSNYNCLFLTSFPDGRAIGRLINLDSTEEQVIVEFNARSISEPSKFRMNEVQGLGAEITYMRRYLYFLILDVVEADAFDAESGKDIPAPKVEPKKPVSTEKREEIKQNITTPKANADALQIKALRAVLKKLKEVDPTQEEFVQKVAIKTEGFTKISKSACEQLILKLGEMVENYNIREE